ncbi:MAG: HAD family hydrolase [Chloroflexi bacterium]|nr:HAD family hydrolase [Chloroflexota bacterium]
MDMFPIRHILFDLGGTLMYSQQEWPPILERADQALANKLTEYEIDLDTKLFRARLHEYYDQREKDFQETTYHFVLRELLTGLGYADVAEPVLRSALDALYAVTQTNWEIEADALSTVRELKSRNYHLGIFSNAGDDKDVQELIESFGIRPYFDFALTSPACFYRKPHPRAFEIALAHWSISPEDAVMIGDSLEADIYGAQCLQMKTIWITRRAQIHGDERIQPDFSLPGLEGLIPTLERLNLTRG